MPCAQAWVIGLFEEGPNSLRPLRLHCRDARLRCPGGCALSLISSLEVVCRSLKCWTLAKAIFGGKSTRVTTAPVWRSEWLRALELHSHARMGFTCMLRSDGLALPMSPSPPFETKPQKARTQHEHSKEWRRAKPHAEAVEEEMRSTRK